VGAVGVSVDPELRKRVEQIKSSPVQLYREAGDYSNRELVEGIVVSPDDIAAIEAVARGKDDLRPAERHAIEQILGRPYGDPDDDAAIAARAAIRLAYPKAREADHYPRSER
jgi:hypothetical protein